MRLTGAGGKTRRPVHFRVCGDKGARTSASGRPRTRLSKLFEGKLKGEGRLQA